MFGGFEFIALIPFVIAIYWKFKQNKLITGTVKTLEEKGRFYYGQIVEGKPKLIVLTAINKRGKILDAKMIRMVRLLKQAELIEMPEMVGRNIEEIKPSKISDDLEVRGALKNLKQNFINANSDNEPPAVKRVKTKRVVPKKVTEERTGEDAGE